MEIFRNPRINFLKAKYIAFLISGLIIIAGLIFINRNGLNYGIDFVGGTLIQMKFSHSVKIDTIRKELKKAGFGSAVIQAVENSSDEYIIRVEKIGTGEEEEHLKIAKKIMNVLMPPDERKLATEKNNLNTLSESEIKDLLAKSFPEEKATIWAKKIGEIKKEKKIIRSFEELLEAGIPSAPLNYLKEKTFIGSISIMRVEYVGPQVGKILRHKAVLATIWALLGMLIYIAFRFKFLYGISAVLTLAHDVLVTLAFIYFLKIEFNLQIVAAILTIVGYSINDTIVVFDRVRENMPAFRKKKDLNFDNLLNSSINQTISRTVLTSGTTLLALLALYLFGGEVIRGFALTMLIGVIVGTYSSIYQSCAWLSIWNKFYGLKGLLK
ncbi:MAG TPA: protein translocase subunit SecF [candidate division WOR-3 bacterium]|uniref:Protein-export membrane protein SecF n=1 Tax=candidate division WOR-3 bacterium TaxID=2052148 RepID=A0A7C5HP53_UNCW3|nr:protein translocase subunit SecF [candidate division WOR-3 bacterium]